MGVGWAMTPERQALIYLLSLMIGIPGIVFGVLVLGYDWSWRRSRNLDACAHIEVDYVTLAPSPLGNGEQLIVSFNVCRSCGKEGV